MVGLFCFLPTSAPVTHLLLHLAAYTICRHVIGVWENLILIDFITKILALNAVAAFLVAFYFQVTLILRLYRDSAPGNAFGNPNSKLANLGRFWAGEIYPDLHPKWSKAVLWVVISYGALFTLGIVKEAME